MPRVLNVTFDQSEFEELSVLKQATEGREESWHDALLRLARQKRGRSSR